MSLFQTVLAQVRERLSLQEHDLSSVAECITNITNVPLVSGQLRIKKGVLLVQVPPTLKLAILAKREAILLHCKEHLIAVHAIA
jgi:hypothetical protein